MEAIESFSYTYSLKIKQLEDALSIASEDVNLAKTGKDISSSGIAQNLENLKMSISTKEDSLGMAKIGEIQAEKSIELARQEKISKLAEIDANLSGIRSKLSEVGSKKAEVQMNVNMAANSLES